jgi:energy-coupling factor transport system permease protein
VVVLLGGVIGPLVLAVVAVLLPAAWAGQLRPVVRASMLLALPLAISAALVNLFFFPGVGTVLFQLGPIRATAEGAVFAFEIVIRVLVIAGALTLFYRTTRTSDLVIDLERRGVSPRLAFIARSAVTTVPAMVDRASTITDAQRARGLDTQGSVWRRIRGIVPMVGPTIMGAINEVEERTLALEARGFTRPGRRTLLWAPSDTGRQRLARWLVVAIIPLVLVLRGAGLELP